MIQVITNQEIHNDSTLILFIHVDSHKVYFWNLDTEFGDLLGSDFCEHCNCGIDFKKRQLITNFKIMQFLTDATVLKNTSHSTHFAHVNSVNIEARTDKACKLKCYLDFI